MKTETQKEIGADAPYCKCAETLIEKSDGTIERIPIPRVAGGAHDCDYVRRRNSFIPLAHQQAMELAGPTDHPAHGNRFTKHFSVIMDRLASN